MIRKLIILIVLRVLNVRNILFNLEILKILLDLTVRALLRNENNVIKKLFKSDTIIMMKSNLLDRI